MRKFTIKATEPKPAIVPYQKELNDEQRAVVMVGKGPLLVIAGAGSGKARTVTYRVTRLIEAGVNLSRILLMTFANRSARAIVHLVETLLKQEVRRVWGGTFHSIAIASCGGTR